MKKLYAIEIGTYQSKFTTEGTVHIVIEKETGGIIAKVAVANRKYIKQDLGIEYMEGKVSFYASNICLNKHYNQMYGKSNWEIEIVTESSYTDFKREMRGKKSYNHIDGKSVAFKKDWVNPKSKEIEEYLDISPIMNGLAHTSFDSYKPTPWVK